MGLQDLQEFIETNCPKAAIHVEIDKVAWRKRGGAKNRVPSSQVIPLFLVLDAESCLHRLYGGSFTDWACGGQWNQMHKFITTLIATVRKLNVELVVFFNGSLEKDRMESWSHDQVISKGNVRNILNHIQRKGIPPPRVWFTPPVCLDHCIRLALIECGVHVQQSTKDHHREIMAYCRGNAFHGIIGHSADYIVFDPPRYFSSHQLKLSRDARMITTDQFLLDEVSKHLEIPQSSLPLLASLLGNHILTEEDISSFQWNLIEPDPEDTAEFRTNRVKLPPGANIIPAIAKYIRELEDPEDFDTIAENVFKNSRGDAKELAKRLKDSVSYFRSASRNGGRGIMLQQATKAGEKDESFEGKNSEESEINFCEDDIDKLTTMFTEKMELDTPKKSNGLSHTAQTNEQTSPRSNQDLATLPTLSADVLRIAQHRHSLGLMHPYLYQVVQDGEIKIPISIEDDRMFPPVAFIYQPARQHIYGVLFSIALNPGKRRVLIKEWWALKGKSLFTPEITEALPLKEWRVPSLQQLWLGREPEDKNRRMRAFLSCLRCDTPGMLNQQFVPRHALVLCCVLRYLMQFPTPLLRRYEVDAFLATAVSPMLRNPFLIQDVETPTLTPRGLLLSSLFMRGANIALFANDVCGNPIPIMLAAPWNYFDGKLFQMKLALAVQDGSNLVQLCEGRVDQVAKVERMRQAIMEGCNYSLAKTPLPSPPAMISTAAFMGGYPNPAQTPPKSHYNPRNYPGSHWDHNSNFSHPGMFHQPAGQLKVAGYTVGNWAGGDTQFRPPFHGHGRGGHGRGHSQIPGKGRGMWFGGAGDAPTKSFY